MKFHLFPFHLFFSHTLTMIEHSPEVMRIKPIKADLGEPGCRLPKDFSGYWANAAKIDADLLINDTHLIETYNQGKDRYHRDTYVCKEQSGSRIMIAHMTVDGW